MNYFDSKYYFLSFNKDVITCRFIIEVYNKSTLINLHFAAMNQMKFFNKFNIACAIAYAVSAYPVHAVGNRVLGGENIYENDCLTFNIKAQLLVDEVNYHNKRNLLDPRRFNSGASFRNSEVYMYGDINPTIKYCFGMGFNPPTNLYYDSYAYVSDAYIQFSVNDYFQIYVGNFQNFYGMNTMTNITDRFFLESDLSTIAFEPQYGLGAAATYNLCNRGTIGIAVTTEDATLSLLDNDGLTQSLRLMSLNTPKNSPVMYSGRITALPWAVDDCKVLHVGVHGYTFKPQYDIEDGNKVGKQFYNEKIYDEDSFGLGYGIISYLYPESGNRTTFNQSLFFIDNKIEIAFPKWIKSGGIELAFLYNQFAFQSEYNYLSFNQFVNPITNQNPKYSSKGGYAQVEYVVFGGQRFYQPEFGLIGPIKVDECSRYGAMSLDFRASYLNMRDSKAVEADLGKGNNYTLGLNYLVNNNVSVKLNYIFSEVKYINNAVMRKAKANALAVRFQAIF